jgi:hypothetical protein
MSETAPGLSLGDVLALRPHFAHPDWRLAERGFDGEAYQHRRSPLTLIWSVAIEADGRRWQHMSMAHRDRTPRWEELIAAKEWLMGGDCYAYQVAPPRAVYVNTNPNVLHLFRCLDAEAGAVLPEFSGVVNGKRTL